MGIPCEVVESAGGEGFGSSSGREIPETAFYSVLQEELNWLIYDFVEQIARPAVTINASLGLLPYDTFEVLSHPLNSSPEEMTYEDDNNDGKPDKTNIDGKNQQQKPKKNNKDGNDDDPQQPDDQPKGPRLSVAA